MSRNKTSDAMLSFLEAAQQYTRAKVGGVDAFGLWDEAHHCEKKKRAWFDWVETLGDILEDQLEEDTAALLTQAGWQVRRQVSAYVRPQFGSSPYKRVRADIYVTRPSARGMSCLALEVKKRSDTGDYITAVRQCRGYMGATMWGIKSASCAQDYALQRPQAALIVMPSSYIRRTSELGECILMGAKGDNIGALYGWRGGLTANLRNRPVRLGKI